MTEELTKLRGIRQSYLRNISNQNELILTVISAYTSDDEIQLKAKKNSLLEKIEKVKQLDTEIIKLLKNDAIESELDAILSRSDDLHEILVKIDTCLSSQKQIEKLSNMTINSSYSDSSAKIKLPKLEIPKFDGEVTNWQSFWDHFESAIHLNDELSDINKFNYLTSFLCDDAKSVISSLAPTSANYQTAVNILKKRYGNPQVLISSFMNKFVSLSKVNSDKDIVSLRKLLDQTESSIRNLESLNVKTDSYGTLLVPLINDKLPDGIRISIAKKFDNDLWDIETLVELLRKEVEAKERSFAVGATFQNNSEINSERELPFTSSALFSQNKQCNTNQCVFCDKSNHASFRCLKVSNPISRKEIVREKRLCFLCLKNGHSAKNCELKYSCNKCGGKHNISICTFKERRGDYNNPINNKSQQATTANLSNNKNCVLLQTASVSVSGNDKRVNNVQLLFDSGSQRSYVSKKLRKLLNLPTLRTERIIRGDSGQNSAF